MRPNERQRTCGPSRAKSRMPGRDGAPGRISSGPSSIPRSSSLSTDGTLTARWRFPGPLALGLLTAAAAGAVRAQAPAPILRDVVPPAGLAGGTVRVTLAGKGLEGVSGLVFSAPGFQA